jgi:hypothetical protein
MGTSHGPKWGTPTSLKAHVCAIPSGLQSKPHSDGKFCLCGCPTWRFVGRCDLWTPDVGLRTPRPVALACLASSLSKQLRTPRCAVLRPGHAAPAADAAVLKRRVTLTQSLSGPGSRYRAFEPEPPRNHRSPVRVPIVASPSSYCPVSVYLVILKLIPNQIIYMRNCEL